MPTSLYKFIFILLFSSLIPPFVLYLLGTKLFQLPCYISFIISLTTILSILYSLLKNFKRDSVVGILSQLRYNPAFPVYFYYDGPTPKKYKFKVSQNDILPKLKKGDILLRRMENYIDGLILQQNTYFTHAAIYAGTPANPVVYEAVGSGIKATRLKDFIKCDDFTILRPDIKFIDEWMNKPKPPITSFFKGGGHELNILQEKPWQDFSLLINEIENAVLDSAFNSTAGRKSFEKYIIYSNKLNAGKCDKCNTNQEKLYEGIKERYYDNYKLKGFLANSNYQDIVCNQAKCLKGVEYDFLFNFVNSNKMSCVEFAWYCYRGLFLIHQITRKKYTFFNWFKSLIIVPDQFIESRLFKQVYPACPGSVKIPKLNYWHFLIKHFLCMVIILDAAVLIYFLKRLLCPA